MFEFERGLKSLDGDKLVETAHAVADKSDGDTESDYAFRSLVEEIPAYASLEEAVSLEISPRIAEEVTAEKLDGIGPLDDSDQAMMSAARLSHRAGYESGFNDAVAFTFLVLKGVIDAEKLRRTVTSAGE